MYVDHSAMDTFFAGKVSAQIVWRCLEVLQATRAGQDGCVCKTGAAVCAVSAGTWSRSFRLRHGLNQQVLAGKISQSILR